jgi:bifunctional DNA-binding transcriptional regulator/antitoxin component of YhaV-PrlF toxin-antitoxin module
MNYFQLTISFLYDKFIIERYSRRFPMAEAAKIASRYQVTIPRKVRRDLKVAVGDLLVFVKEGGEWKVRTIPEDPVEALKAAGKALKAADFRKVHDDFEQGWQDSARD